MDFRERLSEDARWWANFGLIILAVLVIVSLLVVSRRTWFPDRVNRHA